MKLKFLGTAAAEGIPAVFCNCNACKRAKALGGKNIRTRSQILIDADTLFDFPMDTYMHMLEYGIDLSAVKRVLITHAHMDHCYPQEFCMRGHPYAKNMTEKNITVFCNATVKKVFAEYTKVEMNAHTAEAITVRALNPFDEIIDGDIRIVAVPAKHTKGEDCFVYYVERCGDGVLLMNDTGILDREVFTRLAGMNVNVKLAALDCTYGVMRHGAGRHMGLLDIADQRDIMNAVGLTDEHTRFIATHLSHNADIDYDSIASIADGMNITVAFDGMEVDTNNRA